MTNPPYTRFDNSSSGSSLPPLTDLVKNTTTDALESFLTASIGISENQVRPETSPSGLLRAQFRHALFYSFQDQNDIDSKRNLFHRQDQDYVGRDIRDTLPYFLGAMDQDALTKQAELHQATRRLRQLERELRNAQSSGSVAAPQAQALVDEAKQVGLVDERTTTATEERTLSVLHALAADSTIRDQEIIEDGEDLLSALRSERQGLRMEFERINAEVRNTRMFASESSAYASEAREQRARLSAVGLIDNGTPESDHCPVCSSPLEIPPPSVRQLQESLKALDDELETVQSENPRVQMRLAQLLSEQTELRQRLRENQRRISARIQENEILRVQRDNFILQARTIGKVQQYLEAADLVDDNAALRRSVDAQRDRIAVLEQDLDPEVIRDAITAYCNIIGSYMTAYSDRLGLEHGGSQLRLDARNLTVVADTDSGPVPLGQMGSGENWVGYHVLAHLGLHKWFRRRNRPVPGFLFFDQPSQAHYPSTRDQEGSLADLPDEDQEAVRRLFRLIFDVAEELKADFQLILMDHVDLSEHWFEGAVVQRWRGGRQTHSSGLALLVYRPQGTTALSQIPAIRTLRAVAARFPPVRRQPSAQPILHGPTCGRINIHMPVSERPDLFRLSSLPDLMFRSMSFCDAARTLSRFFELECQYLKHDRCQATSETDPLATRKLTPLRHEN